MGTMIRRVGNVDPRLLKGRLNLENPHHQSCWELVNVMARTRNNMEKIEMIKRSPGTSSVGLALQRAIRIHELEH